MKLARASDECEVLRRWRWLEGSRAFEGVDAGSSGNEEGILEQMIEYCRTEAAGLSWHSSSSLVQRERGMELVFGRRRHGSREHEHQRQRATRPVIARS